MELGVTAVLLAGCTAGVILLRLLFEAYAVEKQKESILMESRTYYQSCSGGLPLMEHILAQLGEMLSGSLDLEEVEAQLMFEQMKRPIKQAAAEDCYLAALLIKYQGLCERESIQFRFKLTIPQLFEKNKIDCVILYDCLLGLAFHLSDGRQQYIRIREATKFDIWHLHLAISVTDVTRTANHREKAEVKKVEAMVREEYRQIRRCIKWILRKYHLKCRINNVGNQLELDIST